MSSPRMHHYSLSLIQVMSPPAHAATRSPVAAGAKGGGGLRVGRGLLATGPGRRYSSAPRRTTFPPLSLFDLFSELSLVRVRPWPPWWGVRVPSPLTPWVLTNSISPLARERVWKPHSGTVPSPTFPFQCKYKGAERSTEGPRRRAMNYASLSLGSQRLLFSILKGSQWERRLIHWVNCCI